MGTALGKQFGRYGNMAERQFAVDVCMDGWVHVQAGGGMAGWRVLL